MSQNTPGFRFMALGQMYRADYREGNWRGNLTNERLIGLDPMCAALSYGPAYFEGLKACKAADGRILLFRVHDSALRAQRSAKRLGMEPVPIALFVDAVTKLISVNREYVPDSTAGDLYIRPQSFGDEAILGLGTGETFVFTVSTIPVGDYFAGGFTGKQFLVCTEHCRAAPGGVGDIKAVGNYGAANLIARNAKKAGYAEVLWLDPTGRYPQEIGAANLFWVKNDVLYTPPLDGMILPGINRDSVIKITEGFLGMEVRDTEHHTLQELLEADEAFGTGTAAGVTPIGGFTKQGVSHPYGDGTSPGYVTREISRILTGIKRGTLDDVLEWITEIPLIT